MSEPFRDRRRGRHLIHFIPSSALPRRANAPASDDDGSCHSALRIDSQNSPYARTWAVGCSPCSTSLAIDEAEIHRAGALYSALSDAYDPTVLVLHHFLRGWWAYASTYIGNEVLPIF